MKKVNQKGITLIALVVTIIVLIILAGISISLLFGENGIIKKAQDVSGKYKEASNEENIKLSDLDERMQGILGGNGIQGGSGGNGNNNNTVTPPEETGPLGTPVNTNNYGNIVYNYTAADLIWRLFYEDSNNYYLISETNTGDYPIDSLGLCNNVNNTYVISDSKYESGEDVSRQGRDLMPLLCGTISNSVGTNSSGINLCTSSNTNLNIKETAYLCDSEKWSEYATGVASWAMGGPTVELFALSYNSTHGEDRQIELGVQSYGYSLNTGNSNDWFSSTEYGGIYRLKDSGTFCLASPNYQYNHSYLGVYNRKFLFY